MPNVLDENGLQTVTATEITGNLTTGFEAIYGADTTLTPDTPDGQIIGEITQVIIDQSDLMTNIFNMMDPDQAIGVVLDQRVSINGIQRLGATFTITPVSLTFGQIVPQLQGLDDFPTSPYTVQDEAGNQWQLMVTQSQLAIGTQSFQFQAANPGQVLTTPNTIVKPVTVVLGVTGINNPATYTTLGVNEETDAQLKVRRLQSVGLASQGYYSSLIAALLNIPGLTSAQIFENDGEDYNGNSEDSTYPLGTPPHSIWVIIDGAPTAPSAAAWDATVTYSYSNLVTFSGATYMSAANNNLNNEPDDTDQWVIFNPIAWAIYTKRNSGCGMRGETQYIMPQVNGSFFLINYDTVATQTLWIKFQVLSINGVNPPNIAAITSGLVSNLIPTVGSEVNTNQLVDQVQSIDANSLVVIGTGNGFSTAKAGTYFNILSPTSARNKFSFSAVNVIILPMILQAVGGNLNVVSGLVVSTLLVVHSSGNVQMTGIGGDSSAYTFAFTQNNSGGTIGSSSGIYAPGATPGTDIIQVTDGSGNTAICTVTVT